MTEAELEKEAEKYFKSICEDYNEEYERTGKRHYFVGFDIKNAYLAGAKPREKRIADLEDKLKKETAQRIYNFYKSIKWKEKHRELKAQIEKMKCCYNCKHSRTEYEHCKTDKHEKWEIKENDN